MFDQATPQPEWILQQIPLLLLAVAAPFLLLAWWKRIFPGLPLLLPLAGASLLTVTMLVSTEVVLVVLVIDAVVAVLAAVDLFTLPGARAFAAERETTRVASLKKNHRVTLTLMNLSTQPRSVRLRDDVPQEFLPAEVLGDDPARHPAEFRLLLAPRSRTVVHYEVRAQRRGAFALGAIFLRARSRWGFWHRYLTYPAPSTIHVYPDMQQLSQYAILARTNRLSQMGVRRTRKIGTDNEFERLRDYTLDDNYKHIDWRTTARRNKLTVKDYQTSQSQRIIFLLDCGRMMTNLSGGISLLDHSLNAMLMLSYVALKQGDSVGLLCFSDTVHAYVPPQGGVKHTNQLLHASFDRFPRMVESRYDQAFLYLNRHCKKRSLVVLMTNLIDEVNAHQVQSYLTNLVGRHLPLGVLIRDHRLFDVADREPRTTEALYEAAAAADILNWRHQVLTDLEHKGVLMLDAFPEEMTAPLINTYLDVKARHLL
jgi:uncharacterized protein (DUF58 family)